MPGRLEVGCDRDGRGLRLLSVVVLFALAAGAGCSRHPQVIENEEVFGEMEALYTAVTARRSDLRDDCRRRIDSLHATGKISETGYGELMNVMELADQQKWQAATEELYALMRAQRRQQ